MDKFAAILGLVGQNSSLIYGLILLLLASLRGIKSSTIYFQVETFINVILTGSGVL